MRDRFKKYGSLIYIGLITIVAIILLTHMQELDEIVITLRILDLKWVLAALGCVLVYLALRTIIMHEYLKRRGYPLSWRQVAGVMGAGQFYSAITPSSSGGQPMQIIYLNRMGVPVSLATSCVCVKFLGFQNSILIWGIALAIGHAPTLNDQLMGFRWLVVLGYILNASLVVATVLTIPRSNWVNGLVDKLVRLCAKMHLVKHPEAAAEKTKNSIQDYRNALIQLLQTPKEAILLFILSLLQVLAYMSIPVCLYHAFQLSGTPTWTILTLQLQLFITAAFIPLPGAAGAQESGFYLFYRAIFPDDSIAAAMICWRFFSYYLLMLLGIVFMLAAKFKIRHHDEPESDS